MNNIVKVATFSFLLLAPLRGHAAGEAAHVVVVVWDGMRPDFVSEENTPTLAQLAREGVTFKNHHSAFVSTTIVNGATLATGGYPQDSGIIANDEFRPAINPTKAIGTDLLKTVRRGDELTGNKYLALATVAELVQKSGQRTAIAGAKGVALLQDRSDRSAGALDVNVFAGATLPGSYAGELVQACGEFPSGATNRDDWTTSALIDQLWTNGLPAYSVLWLSEPDSTQHQTAPGSSASLAAMRNSDANLARVLAALDAKGVRDKTDVIVVSDHGFSTYVDRPNLPAVLQAQGIQAATETTGQARAGDVLVVPLGGAALLYVTDHQPADVEKVVRVLQAQSFSGVIFTKETIPGTFALRDARIDSVDAPDIVLSLRWSPAKNSYGTPGILAPESRKSSKERGTHGSLSPYEMHNTCVAVGPDFRRGVQSFLPSGNVDIAPTVLSLLGVQSKHKLSGRVLSEALVGETPVTVTIKPQRLEATHQADGVTWRQYLNFSEVNGVVYFDEGNGSPMPANK